MWKSTEGSCGFCLLKTLIWNSIAEYITDDYDDDADDGDDDDGAEGQNIISSEITLLSRDFPRLSVETLWEHEKV